MSKIQHDIIGTKSSLLWDEDTDAWTYISGKPVDEENPQAFYQIIPTLYRAVDIRGGAVANLPWVIMRGDEEVETSVDYQNKEGLVSSMFEMLYLIEASLVLAGAAYWKREQNPAGFDKLRHLNPDSMELDEKKAQSGEIVWKRNENGVPRTYTTDDIISFWGMDTYVEFGPPSSWPVKSALNACGVLANVDEFAKNYFGRGAIKAMLFTMAGASRETSEEFTTWWNRVISGIQNSWKTRVLNADKMEPVIVGEGIKELENVELTKDKQTEIVLATGIPSSLLFPDAANYATANQDKRNWYEDLIIPEANWIASILNEQLFDELGLRMVFLPETISVMQDDEKERALALTHLVTSGMPLTVALRTLGYELSDEDWKLIEDGMAEGTTQEEIFGYHIESGVVEKNEVRASLGLPPVEDPEAGVRSELLEKLVIMKAAVDAGIDPASAGEMAGIDNFEPKRPAPNPFENIQEEPPDPFEEKAVDLAPARHELSLWQGKCLKAVERGGDASSVAFIPAAISGEVFERVTEGLKIATDTEEIRSVFASALIEKPKEDTETDAMKELIEVLREQNNIATWKGYP